MHTLESAQLSSLFSLLRQEGYTVIGPTVRDGAIVFDRLAGVDQLPRGIEDEQGRATYALRKTESGSFFTYSIGPVSWKKFLFPPRVHLFSVRRAGKTLTVVPPGPATEPPKERIAYVGIRPCELQALALHDKVFLENGALDASYSERRRQSLFIAVNCTHPGGNCFCSSMHTGPRAEQGFDIALTEMQADDRAWFAVDTGSKRGEDIVAGLGCREANASEADQVERAMKESEKAMTKSVTLDGLKATLLASFEHAEWDKVAQRCLGCANCTMVCPTCFCSTVEDTTDLGGTVASRWRRWDSCFNADYSKIAGGNIRPTRRSRYRQWLSHKFAYWIDQFDANGCVGCGRCITWCPAGIDVTEEIAKFQGAQSTTMTA